jgi:hypothetical protein
MAAYRGALSIQRRKTSKGSRWDVRLRTPEGRTYTRTFGSQREAETFEAREPADRSRGGWVRVAARRSARAHNAADRHPDGRGGGIRTPDRLPPKQVRYRCATPRLSRLQRRPQTSCLDPSSGICAPPTDHPPWRPNTRGDREQPGRMLYGCGSSSNHTVLDAPCLSTPQRLASASTTVRPRPRVASGAVARRDGSSAS